MKDLNEVFSIPKWTTLGKFQFCIRQSFQNNNDDDDADDVFYLDCIDATSYHC